MRRSWSIEENRQTIEDYFSMLAKEVQEEPYNKTAHRDRLMTNLDERSSSAVEKKHQNISGVLRHLGFPFIDGYKPLDNYQLLLKDLVVQYLDDHPGVVRALEAPLHQSLAPRDPSFASSSELLEAPPALLTLRESAPRSSWDRHPTRYDFVQREGAMLELGKMGERFALAWEQERLRRAGRDDLARRVEWSAETKGDGCGFDIASFEETGAERFIEVKTTNYGKRFPFFISNNEVRFSQEHRPSYSLYRLFRFSLRPRLFILQGAMSERCRLIPHIYQARF